jgi:DNA topoisomerase VI subunit A
MSVNPINTQTLLQANNQSVGDEGGPLQIIRNIHKVIVELTSKIASGECKKKEKEKRKHKITFNLR